MTTATISKQQNHTSTRKLWLTCQPLRGQADWEIAGNLMYKDHILSGGKEVILFRASEHCDD